jgi:hypothetical protein
MKQKVLLIHFDEKWFFGMAPRANAKVCEQLGVEKEFLHCFHKSHVTKAMGIAFTGLAFDGDIEKGR